MSFPSSSSEAVAVAALHLLAEAEDAVRQAGLFDTSAVVVYARKAALKGGIEEVARQYVDFDDMKRTLVEADAAKVKIEQEKALSKLLAISPGGALEPVIALLKNKSTRDLLMVELGDVYKNTLDSGNYSMNFEKRHSLVSLADKNLGVDTLLGQLIEGRSEGDVYLVENALFNAYQEDARLKHNKKSLAASKGHVMDSDPRFSPSFDSVLAVSLGLDTRNLNGATYDDILKVAHKQAKEKSTKVSSYEIGFEQKDLLLSHLNKVFPEIFTENSRYKISTAFANYETIKRRDNAVDLNVNANQDQKPQWSPLSAVSNFFANISRSRANNEEERKVANEQYASPNRNNPS